MKVILKQEVDNLGLAGDVVDVADGYGRNYLLPRGMAMLASRGAMKQAEALTRSRKAVEAQTMDQATEYRTVLEDRTLRIPARVDERGHLYGSVTANDVHRILKERGHEIERKRIDLKGSIKEIGTYEIPVQVHPQVMATVTIDVVDEEGVVIAGQIAEPEVAPLPGEVVEPTPGDAGEASDGDDELARLEAEALAAAAELDAATGESESGDADAADDQGGDEEDAAGEAASTRASDA